MIFADTNILVYALDPDEPLKRELAARALRQAEASRLVISTQVLQELYVALLRRKLAPAAAAEAVAMWSRREVVTVTTGMVLEATELHRRHRLEFWDALILHTAAAAGCTTLLTEDMQHGREIAGVRIVNPFLHELHEAEVAYALRPARRGRPRRRA